VLSEQGDAISLAHSRDTTRHVIDVDRVRRFPFHSEGDGEIGPMAATGVAQASE
jgi:hypothetical protein